MSQIQPIIQFLFLLGLLVVVSCIPALAHEGSAGEHLILGLDAGLVIGIATGFVAGVGSTLLYLRKFGRR